MANVRTVVATPIRLMLTGLLLAPLLLAQGKSVRRRMPRLPEPEGEREGAIGGGLPLRLLILGDSAAAGVGVARQEEALSGCLLRQLAPSYLVHWRLLARTGLTTAGIAARMRKQEAEGFDVAVVSAGVNDVTGHGDARRWIGDIEQLVMLLRERNDTGLILLAGLPPMQHFSALPRPLRGYLGARATLFNRHLAYWVRGNSDCQMLSLPWMPDAGLIAEDGFHPSARAYACWAELVAEQVRLHREHCAAVTASMQEDSGAIGAAPPT